jgi:hypothetical protein
MHDQIVPVINKYDEALNQADPHKNKLLLQLSHESLTFCIFNLDSNKFLSIETVYFEPNSRVSEIAFQLKQFYSDHQWLKQPFHSIKLLFESNRSTLVPSPLFDEGEKASFSNFNFTVNEDEIVLFNKLKNLDAYIVFSVPELIIKTTTELFPDHISFCHSGAFIESLLILNKNLKAEKRLFVNTRNNFLDIAILDGRKLLFFNTFKYQSKEDFIYFVIFVFEQLQLNPEEIELILMGTIDKNSRIFDTIYKYVRNVSFQPKTEAFNYSYVFNEIHSHNFFNLINFELCEL